MLYRSIITKKTALLITGVWILFVISYQLMAIRGKTARDKLVWEKSWGSNITTVDELPRVSRLILFPRDFPIDDRRQMMNYYAHISDQHLPRKEQDYFIGKYNPGHAEHHQTDAIDPRYNGRSLPFAEDITNHPFQKHEFSVFSRQSPADEKREGGGCDLAKTNFKIEASLPKHVGLDMRETIKEFYHSSYYKEFADAFTAHPLKEQIQSNTVHEYWFRFGGSSVYLEQYGVHYMVSRLTYSSRKDRGIGEITFLVGEVYDRNWSLIPNVEMIVPTNDPDHTGSDPRNDVHFVAYKASAVLSIPIFQRFKTAGGTFFGAEDPRLILIRNPRGFEEPLAVFNQNHRKLVKVDEGDLNNPKVEFKQYRSLFQSYLWQSQRGKRTIDGLPAEDAIKGDMEGSEVTPEKLYTRTVELRIANHPRLSTQKNWTPFTSQVERLLYGFDERIYYIYRWEDLDVLLCPLVGTDTEVLHCEFVYRTVKSKSIEDGPGDFRGGTALISVNSLLAESSAEHELVKSLHNHLDESGGEAWVGFARAHFKNCGCGPESFYRPNLVIVTRALDGSFSISEAGTYTALGVTVDGWHSETPEILCTDGLSVLIANLIAQWTIWDVKDKVVEDYATLTISVADASNIVLHLKGLLAGILSMDLTQKGHALIFSGEEGSKLSANAHIKCALEESKQFCAAFGDTFRKSPAGKNSQAKKIPHL